MTANTDLTKQFAGRYAVITGGTQGVGEAVARLFAERGAAGLVIAGRSAERGQALATDLTKGGCKTRFKETELSDLDDCAALIAEADSAFGNLHCLVNCAAFTDRGTILDTEPEFWDKMMDVNARAPFFLIQGAARIMRRERTPGAIASIISIVMYGGVPRLIAYAASKAALSIVTRSAANSLRFDRIRVNGLNIGWTDTPAEDIIQRTFHGGDDRWLERTEAKMPFGRLLKPHEVARAVAFLCSDESGMMTGSLVDFDQTVHGTLDDSPHPSAEAAQ
jgi:NAD(P)-dependent dehydrogenase (short-subunit alcohol dehydrogenase family)